MYDGYKAILMLEDGSIFKGIGFGYPSTVIGEVVFNTGMVGYTEALTDPSYKGQMLCLTYPLVGNYGVPSYDVKDDYNLPMFFESDSIKASALIIHELSSYASHYLANYTLDEWLYNERIPGIYGIDTRELTKRLRVKGVMMGILAISSRHDKDIDIDELRRVLSDTIEGIKRWKEFIESNKDRLGIVNAYVRRAHTDYDILALLMLLKFSDGLRLSKRDMLATLGILLDAIVDNGLL